MVAATGLADARSIHPESPKSFPEPLPKSFPTSPYESFSKSFTPPTPFDGVPHSLQPCTQSPAPTCSGSEAEVPRPEPTTTGSADPLITSLLMIITSLHAAKHVHYFCSSN